MISKDKTYCTRGGQQVRIYATDAGGLFPVHGAIFTDGIWNGMKWTAEGYTHVGFSSHVHVSMDDLAEVKPRHKRTVWINVYEETNEVSAWHTRKHADTIAASNRIACIKVDLDFEEGEGITHGTYSVSSGGSPSFDNGGGFTPSQWVASTEKL